jgi:hypothetical protein
MCLEDTRRLLVSAGMSEPAARGFARHPLVVALGTAAFEFSRPHAHDDPSIGVGACELMRMLRFAVLLGRRSRDGTRETGPYVAIEIVASEMDFLRNVLKVLRKHGAVAPARAVALWRAAQRWTAASSARFQRGVSHLKLMVLPDGSITIKLYLVATMLIPLDGADVAFATGVRPVVI